jgi:hypothetical protein
VCTGEKKMLQFFQIDFCIRETPRQWVKIGGANSDLSFPSQGPILQTSVSAENVWDKFFASFFFGGGQSFIQKEQMQINATINNDNLGF